MKKTKTNTVNNVLSGENNARLDDKDSLNSEVTAAWADVEQMCGQAKVPVPSKEGTDEAKDWVDNGSQL